MSQLYKGGVYMNLNHEKAETTMSRCVAGYAAAFFLLLITIFMYVDKNIDILAIPIIAGILFVFATIYLLIQTYFCGRDIGKEDIFEEDNNPC